LDKFKIFETNQFSNDLSKDFEGQAKRIQKKLLEYVYPQLRINPFYGNNIKKLKGYSPDTWRYRIGKYRFFYEIDIEESLVIMIAAESRQGSY
jgi:mRNA interferase RelE/StbE